MKPSQVNAIPRGCDGKRRYQTRRLAKRISKRISQRRKTKLYPYYCEICLQWHLGHSQDKP